jgi:hypothetical protein
MSTINFAASTAPFEQLSILGSPVIRSVWQKIVLKVIRHKYQPTCERQFVSTSFDISPSSRQVRIQVIKLTNSNGERDKMKFRSILLSTYKLMYLCSLAGITYAVLSHCWRPSAHPNPNPQRKQLLAPSLQHVRRICTCTCNLIFVSYMYIERGDHASRYVTHIDTCICNDAFFH